MELVTGRKGAAHITSQQARQKNQGIWGKKAYILKTGNQMAASIQSANTIQIKDGALMYQGALFSVKVGTTDSVTIPNGSQGMQRRDLVVARYKYNQSSNTESAEWVLITGTPAASNPQTPACNQGDIQNGDLTVDCPVFLVSLDGVNIMGIEQIPPFATCMQDIGDNIDYIVKNTYVQDIDKSLYALQSHWKIMEWNTWKKGSLVYLNAEIFTSSILQANYKYIINKEMPVDDSVKPKKKTFLHAVATDMTYDNAVAVYAVIDTNGEITIDIPETERRYVFLSGAYETLTGAVIPNGDEVDY